MIVILALILRACPMGKQAICYRSSGGAFSPAFVMQALGVLPCGPASNRCLSSFLNSDLVVGYSIPSLPLPRNLSNEARYTINLVDFRTPKRISIHRPRAVQLLE